MNYMGSILMTDDKVLSIGKPIGSYEVNSICKIVMNHNNLVNRFKRLFSPLGSNFNLYFKKKHFCIISCISIYYFPVFYKHYTRSNQ